MVSTDDELHDISRLQRVVEIVQDADELSLRCNIGLQSLPNPTNHGGRGTCAFWARARGRVCVSESGRVQSLFCEAPASPLRIADGLLLAQPTAY